MARKASVWWRESRRQWYTTVQGEQIPLGVFDPGARAAAVAALQKLLGLQAPDAAADPPAAEPLSALVPRFLADRGPSIKPRSVAGYGEQLTIFLARFGTEPAAGLTAKAVEDDIRARKPGWGDNTRRN